MEEFKVAEDVAIQDVKAFVEFHKEESFEDEKIKEDYPDVIKAVQRGLMTFDEEQTPVFRLRSPLKTESGGIALDEVTFKTRIIESDKARLAKGIDFKNDTFTFLSKLKAYYIGQPVALLDKMGKFDLRVIDQVSSVF